MPSILDASRTRATFSQVIGLFQARSRTIPSSARPLYDLLCSLQAGRHPIPLSMTDICAALDVSESTAIRMSGALRVAGVLDVQAAPEHVRRRGGVNRYRLRDAGRHGCVIAATSESFSTGDDGCALTSPEAPQLAECAIETTPVAEAGESLKAPCTKSLPTLSASDRMRVLGLLFREDISEFVAAAIESKPVEWATLNLSESDEAALRIHVVLERARLLVAEVDAATTVSDTQAVALPVMTNQPKTSGPETLQDVLSRVSLSPPPRAPEKPASFVEIRLRSAWGRIKSALGFTERAKAVWAEIRWSATDGQLSKLGPRAVDVALRLVESGKWTVPFHIPDEAYRSAREVEFLCV